MKIEFGGRTLLVADEAMEKTLALAGRAAKTEFPVLITGESGTGKELVARYIHESSRVAKGAFVSVNCAAIPDALMESELFGYERGAFTGAYAQRIGKFERASGGTILLDEISEMPLHLQAKLLRVLQEGEIDRVGGVGPIRIQSRVVATSNRDLVAMVRQGEFRADLFFRLNVVHIACTSLRGRQKAILALAQSFLQRRADALDRCEVQLDPKACEKLLQHGWPGNVRELENTIERALLTADGPAITAENLELVSFDAARTVSPAPAEMTLARIERTHIKEVLSSADGNRSRAAQMLGISVRTLRNKLKDYSIDEA